MTRRNAVPAIAWAAALAACVWWLATQLVVTADLSAFLPRAATPSQDLLVSQLRDGVASRVVIVGLEGADAKTLADASRRLAATLADDQRFVSVVNGDPARFAREQQLIARWRYLMSPAITRDRFTIEGLRRSIGDALRLLASPVSAIVERTIASDPTGETLRLALTLAGGSNAPATREGVWFSPDGTRALLLAQTRAAGFDLDAQRQAAEAIRTAFVRETTGAVRLVMSSPGLLAVQSRESIQRDARIASSATLVGVLLLMLATYRSMLPALLAALPALSGLALGIVAVGIAFGPVHAITLGFGAVLIGEAIDYPTYLYANRAAGESLEVTQRRIGRTLMLAVATTACGALAMLLSGFRGLAQLGLLILVGVVTAGLVTRYLLPAVTPDRSLAHKAMQLPIDAEALLAALRRHSWIAVAALALAAVVLVVRRDALWEDDLASLNPLVASAKTADRELRLQSGAPDLRYLVVVYGPDRESALAATERVAVALDDAVARAALAGFDDAARYLPSEGTQRRRRDALPDRTTLAKSLAAVVADTPFRDDAFASFVDDVDRARSGPLLTRGDLDGTALALKVDSFLFAQGDRWISLVPLHDVKDAAALRTAIGSAQLLDLKAEADALVAGYRAQSLRSTAIGFAAIVVIVRVGAGSVATTLRLLVPVLGAVLLTTATLVASGEKLTIFHLVSLLLVVGVGLNYALFYGRRAKDAGEANLTSLSVAVAGLATLCASVSLALTGTPVLRAIGLTTGIGALFAFLLSAAFSKQLR
ncbi:MAG TPA: MMPL family transporter [Casimicrobiaceae bacterium]|nr:MMPL family transporter [Casimicrobiaceae bacterium]